PQSPASGGQCLSTGFRPVFGDTALLARGAPQQTHSVCRIGGRFRGTAGRPTRRRGDSAESLWAAWAGARVSRCGPGQAGRAFLAGRAGTTRFAGFGSWPDSTRV